MYMSEALEIQDKSLDRLEKIKTRPIWKIAIGIAVLILITSALAWDKLNLNSESSPFPFLNSLTTLGKKKKTFEDKFNKKNGKIEETAKMSGSSSSKWWVNSGGWLEISGGTGKTIQGDLSSDNKWHQRYEDSSSEDTDEGLHPQNIFRLVTRGKWQNFQQQVLFRINRVNLSDSDNRNESNGVLLFNRYQDGGDDLYYTGLRVDGYAVIKKKIGGDYHTLAYEKVYSGAAYDRDDNPNLLPVGKWIGLRSEVRNNKNGDVEIKLYYKKGRNTKKWKLVAQYVDKGQKGDEIKASGYGGIRSDLLVLYFK